MADIGWPSQKSCNAKACRGVRIAEAHGRLLQERPRRMHVGEGAASKAPARETLDARQAEQWEVKQAIAVRAVPQVVVDPPVVGGERPPAAAWRAVHLSLPGDGRGSGLQHLTPLGTRAVSPQGAKLSIREEGRIP